MMAFFASLASLASFLSPGASAPKSDGTQACCCGDSCETGCSCCCGDSCCK